MFIGLDANAPVPKNAALLIVYLVGMSRFNTLACSIVAIVQPKPARIQFFHTSFVEDAPVG